MFSKKPAPEARPTTANPMASSSTFSVIGSDITIKGDISASADLHVDGRIEGDISCSSLVQGEGSEIVGTISSETARLAGTIKGSISARELTVLKTARIEGDVQYDALTIEQGAEVEGRFSHRAATKTAPAETTKPADTKPSGDDEPRLTLAS